METLQIRREDFGKILDTANQLLEEVAQVFPQDEIAGARIKEIKSGAVKGKTEADLHVYLKKRGLNIE